MACKACDHLLPFRERGVACCVLGEEGLRFGLITGEPENARTSRDRLDGVVLGLVGDVTSTNPDKGEVGVLRGIEVDSPTTFSVTKEVLFTEVMFFWLYFLQR